MQTKQKFTVDDIEVLIFISPWKVKTKSGLQGGIVTEVMIFKKNGYGVRGQAVMIPTDVFDFRIGAKLALQRALHVKPSQNYIIGHISTSPLVWNDSSDIDILTPKIRKKIWDAFNKVLPE